MDIVRDEMNEETYAQFLFGLRQLCFGRLNRFHQYFRTFIYSVSRWLLVFSDNRLQCANLLMIIFFTEPTCSMKVWFSDRRSSWLLKILSQRNPFRILINTSGYDLI